MRNLKTILILFTLVVFTTTLSSQDSTRKISWAVKVGGGINFLIKPVRLRANKNEYYTLNTGKGPGYMAEVGIKLTQSPKKNLFFSFELNYFNAEYSLNYTGSNSAGHGSGIDYTAEYTCTTHNFQFALMENTIAGTKKKMYVSMGLCGSVPFYYINKGYIKKENWSLTGTNSIEIFNDKQIANPIRFNAAAVLNVGWTKDNFSFELRFLPGITYITHQPTLKSYALLLSAAYSF